MTGGLDVVFTGFVVLDKVELDYSLSERACETVIKRPKKAITKNITEVDLVRRVIEIILI